MKKSSSFLSFNFHNEVSDIRPYVHSHWLVFYLQQIIEAIILLEIKPLLASLQKPPLLKEATEIA
jgi:hypothetical protein